MRGSMKSEQLNEARNPLLPAAMVALKRAALKARQVARQTQTAIVITRGGKIERITPYEVQEPTQGYRIGTESAGDGDAV